jgi:hypothetical protein
MYRQAKRTKESVTIISSEDEKADLLPEFDMGSLSVESTVPLSLFSIGSSARITPSSQRASTPPPSNKVLQPAITSPDATRLSTVLLSQNMEAMADKNFSKRGDSSVCVKPDEVYSVRTKGFVVLYHHFKRLNIGDLLKVVTEDVDNVDTEAFEVGSRYHDNP